MLRLCRSDADRTSRRSIRATAPLTFLGLALSALPVEAGVLFRETWEQESVGDDLLSLDAWQPHPFWFVAGEDPGQARIIDVGGGKALRFDPPENADLRISGTTLGTKQGFDVLTEGRVLSLSSRITLIDDPEDTLAPAGVAEMGFFSGGEYNIRLRPDSVTLTTNVGGSEVLASAPVALGYTEHHYEFQTTFHDDAVALRLLVDGLPVLSALDTGVPTFTAPFHFHFGVKRGGAAVFDDFRAVSAVPEPGTLVLMGLGGIGLAIGRIRKRRTATAAA